MSATSHSVKGRRAANPHREPGQCSKAGIRNLVIGAFRKKGHANIAAARRYYGRDDQRILALYEYI